jgi:shingomyelin synthase
VKFSVSDETASVSTAASNPRSGSRNSNSPETEGEVEEDLTLSDRLSHEDLDMDDDGFHQESSKSCESIPQDRLTPDDSDDDRDRRMLPGDSKSQNSDYGSFCQTPSDNFGHLTTTTASDSNNPDSGSRPPNLAMTGTDQPDHPGDRDHDHQGDHDHQDLQRQPLLPPSTPDIHDSSSDDDAGANSSGYTRRKAKHRHLNSNGDSPRGSTALSDTNTDGLHRDLEIKGEPVKTLLAGIFLVFAWVATTTSLALTHERVPEYKPLPDVILDNIKYQSWGLDASEIVIMVATLMAFAVSLFHKHRFIVLRRIFLLVGIHYYYRALTMYVTALPKPNEQYQCAPKTGNDTTPLIIFQRVLKLLSGMGLSINGKHVYCGDYIYSGHTMTLIMTYLVIKEYSPRRWFLFHWFSLGVTTLGIVTLLLSRGHYSIDVVIAYWITTRLWWMYHTLANHEVLKSADNSENYLNKIWWWYIFNYFEGRVPASLPREYGWPIPEKLLQWNFFRRRNLETSEEDLEAGLSRQPSQIHRD